jgi:coenzyme F420-reducing hydrogenase delta subunit
MHSWDNRGPVLAFLCNWAPYRCFMDLCKSGRSLPHPIYPIKVMCSGRVDPAMVLFAFERGAEGVMVLGCKDKECRYGPGPTQSEKTAGTIRRLMHALGLETERFAVLQYADDDKEKLVEDMEAFIQTIAALGKSPFSAEEEAQCPGSSTGFK